jgi:hypothetical protein
VPGAVDAATANVAVELPDPGAAIDAGLKLTVTPDGCPLADNATAELKPLLPVEVMVDVPLLPCTTETDVGLAASDNAGAAVTVSMTVDVCVSPPPMPVTVIG